MKKNQSIHEITGDEYESFRPMLCIRMGLHSLWIKGLKQIAALISNKKHLIAL